MKKIITFLSVVIMSIFMMACSSSDVIMTSSNEPEDSDVKITFEAMLYDNQGNNYVTFKGNKFSISPNRIKQWGYNTAGSWDSWYETSSVVSINIDGNYVQTCGSTVLFKDSRIEIQPLSENIGTLDTSEESGYTSSINNANFTEYIALTNWWFNTHENGQGGNKIVLIQSQDGYNIGLVEGENITWEVAEKLPKTTLIMVDDKPLYIHRCNFTIIDTALFNNVVIPE